MSSEHHPDFLARRVAGVVAWIAHHPWVVLIHAVLLTTVAVRTAYTDLEYHTQRNDLLSADKPCQQRLQKFIDTFGDDDDMVVVAEGTDREMMKAALDAVAEKVKQRPELFDRVFYRVDLRHLRDRAILHLPAEQLDAIAAHLDRMEPLLGPVGPVAWQMLSTQALLANAVPALEARAAGRELSAADRDLLAQLPAVASSAAATLREPENYRNPWALTANPPGADQQGDQLLTPQYFFTPDGSLALFTCRPKKEAGSFTPAKGANDAMRAILSEVTPQFPSVSLGLTGLPVLESDEMDLSSMDSTRASWLALVGVAALYFVVYRGVRYPTLTITTLVIGTLCALGWATVTIGHLNILSATFAVMLVGMGDYGVLWIARYDEARQRGEAVDEALRHAAIHAGPSILTAAATTGLAFFAIMLADFKAVAELGWIAGSGVLLCAISCLTLMPAMLVLVDRRDSRLPTPDSRLPIPGAWIPALADRPRFALGIGATMLAVCAAFALKLTYDHNLLNLQPRGLNSVVWEHKLIQRAAGATWDALSIAHSREEALALKAKYEALPEVSRVVEVASLVPADQERKLPVVRAIHDRLTGLPSAENLPIPTGSDSEAVRELALKVKRLAGSDTALSRAVANLATTIESSPYAANRLRGFDRRMAADLAADLHQLQDVSHPAPITMDDVPIELRERYIGAHGEFLVQAFAKDSLWDYPALQRFTTAANIADPEATGKAFRTLEGLKGMKLGFEWAALYALAAIVLVLLLGFRRVTEVLLVLVPLAAGVTLTLGAMGLFGVSLNPANIIALPLVVGVGVDYGVHVLHDYRSRLGSGAFALGSAIGRGVLIKAVTTMLGFGTLLLARHQGMASLGLALTLGVTLCMVAALVWLPAVLRLRDLRRVKPEAAPEQTVQPLVLEMRFPTTTAKAA
jgi:uncharacterized protein